ncbi:hypothetical protein [Acinetobacter oleivorans]|nr:hypothetical protein [Acinetobacter oleivorans]
MPNSFIRRNQYTYIADIGYNGWQLSIKAIYTLLDQRKHAAIE